MKQQAEFVERKNCVNCESTKLTELSHGRYLDDPLRSFLAADPWGVDPLQFLQKAQWSLVQCADCTQVFHRFILNAKWNERRFYEWMSAEAIQEFESRLHAKNPMWRFERETRHTSHILRIEKLTRTLRGSESVKLLDFGCGWGDFLNSCQRFGFDAVGVDRSVARRQGATVRIEPSLSDVSGPFHAIVLFETLEHLDKPIEILLTLSSLLTPGGILVLETPDCRGVTDIRTKRDYLLVHPLEHINAFDRETMRSIAKRCGFDHVARPSAFITADLLRVAKVFTKSVIRRGENSTQQYFRKL